MSSTAPIATSPATYADILSAPPNMLAELIGGELVLSPRPAARHTRVISRLGFHLGQAENPAPIGESGGGYAAAWWILVAPELHRDSEVLVPDLAGWRQSGMAQIPDVAGFNQPPDWICEVLSRGTEVRDRAVKLSLYLADGVDWAWLIHPRLRTLEICYRQGQHWMLHHVATEGEASAFAPFEGVNVPLADLWLPTQDPAS